MTWFLRNGGSRILNPSRLQQVSIPVRVSWEIGFRISGDVSKSQTTKKHPSKWSMESSGVLYFRVPQFETPWDKSNRLPDRWNYWCWLLVSWESDSAGNWMLWFVSQEMNKHIFWQKHARQKKLPCYPIGLSVLFTGLKMFPHSKILPFPSISAFSVLFRLVSPQPKQLRHGIPSSLTGAASRHDGQTGGSLIYRSWGWKCIAWPTPRNTRPRNHWMGVTL